jgi:hypothetical protein
LIKVLLLVTIIWKWIEKQEGGVYKEMNSARGWKNLLRLWSNYGL